MGLAANIDSIGINDKSSEDDAHQELQRDQPHIPRHDRCLKQDQEEQEAHGERHTPPTVEKGESSVHCFVCQQPKHYATKCPVRKGKGPAVNTITAEIQ